MRFFSRRSTVVALALGLAAPLSLSLPAKAADIVETAASAGNFKTLLAAAKAAGIAGDLAGPGPLTVFAPTVAAFAKLPKGTLESLLKPENKGKLKAILTYHVVPSRISAADVPTKATRVSTLNGAKLRAVRSGHRVHINGARVIKADIRADNGIIHVIDKVLIPPAHS